jgi:hypothetical protein
MSSKPNKEKFKTAKATKLSQKLVVSVKTGEKSPVRSDTPPPTSHQHSRTHSGKIRAIIESEKEYQEAGTEFQNFTKLHQVVYEIISHWAAQPDSRKHKFYQLWLSAWRDAITATSTYQTVKETLYLKSIAGYKDHILQCPAIASALDIWLNHTGNRIRYAITSTEIMETESPTVIAEDSSIVPTYADTMQDDSEESPLHKLDPDLQDAESKKEISSSNSKDDPKIDTPFCTSENVLKMENLDNNALKFLLIDIEEETSPDGTTQHQNRFFHWMADRFNHRLGAIGNYLKDAQFHLDDKLSAVTSRIQEVENMVANLEKVVATNQVKSRASLTTLHQTMQDVDSQVDKHLKHVEIQLHSVSTTISETCQFYESQIKSFCKQDEEDLESTIAKVVTIITQEAIDEHINPKLAEQIHAIDKATKEAITKVEQKKAQNPVRTNNLPPTPWSQRVSSAAGPTTLRNPPNPPHHRNRWGQLQSDDYPHNADLNPPGSATHQRPPHMINPYFTPCNHHDFIKKAQVHYNGKIFTFYNKLRNVGRQYGIYLQALDDIKYEASLCPPSYNGHTFTDMEYEIMAATLYEKLGHTDVIPDQYNQFRTIIDRYADTNDGFLVLYEMLEDEHPAMKQDPIQRPPTSSECQDDIQEYAAHFTSYLVSE